MAKKRQKYQIWPLPVHSVKYGWKQGILDGFMSDVSVTAKHFFFLLALGPKKMQKNEKSRQNGKK